MSRPDDSLQFLDKSTYPIRRFSTADRVRIVPGGSSIRDGAYVAPGVICMPPMYVNVGAYVDEGTMIDSHALVGSCAQIGKRVHLSAAAQIGGVLEPVGALPVIVEDDALVGGGCGIYEGTIAWLSWDSARSGIFYCRACSRPVCRPATPSLPCGTRSGRRHWGPSARCPWALTTARRCAAPT